MVFSARTGRKSLGHFCCNKHRRYGGTEYSNHYITLEQIKELAIIKYPFWRMTAGSRNVTYACINYGEAYAPEEIRNRNICIDADIDKAIAELQSL